MKNYLLDSNILIANLRRGTYEERIKGVNGGLFISVHTHFEILVGIEKSTSEKLRVNKLEAYNLLLSLFGIIDYDTRHAEEAARIRATLERSGKQIGAIDTLIAAQAKVMGFTMVTNNVSEFSRVDGLEVVSWD